MSFGVSGRYSGRLCLLLSRSTPHVGFRGSFLVCGHSSESVWFHPGELRWPDKLQVT